MINRYRMAASKSSKNVDSQILYFKRSKHGTTIESIQISNSGELMGEYVEDYLSFYMEEELNLLSM